MPDPHTEAEGQPVARGGSASKVHVPPMRLVLQPSGWSITLDRPEVILGRHTSADVRLPLPDVSRRHCRFAFQDGAWYVFDMDSLNGVWLNGESVRQALLRQGDRIRIGGFTFQVDLSADDRTEETHATGMVHRLVDAQPQSSTSPRRKAS